MEKQLIYKAMIAVMKDIEAIGKNNMNQQQRFKFRSIDDVYNAVHPLFKKHGIFVTSEIVSSSREERTTAKGGTLLWTLIDVKFSYWAEDGSSVTSTSRGEGMDSGDKSGNKAMSAAQKYSIIQVFCIPTEEGADDGDKESIGSSVVGEVEKIKEEIEKFTDKNRLIEWANENEYYKNKELKDLIAKRISQL